MLDQPSERGDPGLLFAAAGQLAAVYVEGGEVAERAAAVVVVLDALGTAGSWGGGLVGALPGLDLGLLDYPNAVDNRVAGRVWGPGSSGGL